MLGKNKFFKYKKPLFLIAGGFSLFSLGLFFGLNSWDKKLYVSWNPSSQRDLAGEDQDEFLIELSPEEMVEKADQILFNNIRLLDEEDQITFYFEDMLIPDRDSGSYRFLCEMFSHVEFSFAPLGIKLSGDPGSMILQSPCRKEQEFELGPFYFFKKKMLATPKERSFEFEEQEDYISFYRASLWLTESWLLKTIRFFNRENSKEFIVVYNPENNDPFEVTLKTQAEAPRLLLKEGDLSF